MKYLILSILCIATSMHAGKNKAAQKAEQKRIDAENAAKLAAATKANAANSQHETNCPGPGKCWKCGSAEIMQQNMYDKH